MNAICTLGLPELIILALLGFVLIGPDKYQNVAYQAGRYMRKLFASPMWRQVNEMFYTMRNLPDEIMRITELEDALNDVQDSLSEMNQTMQDIGREGQSISVSPDASAAEFRQAINNLNSLMRRNVYQSGRGGLVQQPSQSIEGLTASLIRMREQTDDPAVKQEINNFINLSQRMSTRTSRSTTPTPGSGRTPGQPLPHREYEVDRQSSSDWFETEYPHDEENPFGILKTDTSSPSPQDDPSDAD